MCFCFVLGYVCELFSELVGFLFGCYSINRFFASLSLARR